MLASTHTIKKYHLLIENHINKLCNLLLLCAKLRIATIAEESDMRINIDADSQDILGKSELIIITERVDDVALLISHMLKMELHYSLDKHIPRHWKQRDLSWGLTSVIWLSYILTEGDHRKVSVEKYIKGMENTLSKLIGQKVDPLDFSDDRLAHLLKHMGKRKNWKNIERYLNERSIEIYELPEDVIRCDATTVSGYHEVIEDGLFQFGHSKDDPGLPQIKVMMSTLDPLGMPLATDVVSGEKADDNLYIPIIDRALESLGKTGLLVVGDCKMSALATRTHIEVSLNHYLAPLPMTGTTAIEMEQWIDQGVANRKNGEVELIFKQNDKNEDVLLSFGYEFERRHSSNEGDVKWTERVLIVNSPAHAKRQEEGLEKRLKNAEEKIAVLTPDRARGKRQMTDETSLLHAINEIFKNQRVEGLLVVDYEKQIEKKIKYKGPGRGSANRDSEVTENVRYQITQILRNEEGITALKERFGWKAFVTNAVKEQLSFRNAILCYRNEYRIERIFNRLKSHLNISPLFVKNEEQIQGLTNLLSLGARVLVLIEFTIRRSLQKDSEKISGLYPENPKKTTENPTSERVLKLFSGISLTIIKDVLGNEIMRWLTPLSMVQQEIMKRLGLDACLYHTICDN